MSIPLEHWLTLSTILFCIGLWGALTRRHAIVVLVSIEIMMNAANLNFLAFWQANPQPSSLSGPLFVMFAIAVAAAEIAVGLALVIAIYRHYRSVDLDKVDQLKG